MTMEKTFRHWIQDGIVWVAFVLIGLLAIPVCVSFLLISIVWHVAEVLLKGLQYHPRQTGI